MKHLTIYTQRYSHLLEDFAVHAQANGWITMFKTGRASGLFFINCRYGHSRTAFAKGLLALLADITIQENPIYQHSPKLQAIAHDLHKTPLYDAEFKCLNRFLKHSRALHLEGYTTFRMSDYREKLDTMSYTLIKKLKFNQQD